MHLIDTVNEMYNSYLDDPRTNISLASTPISLVKLSLFTKIVSSVSSLIPHRTFS
jgi:hypothetical protein